VNKKLDLKITKKTKIKIPFVDFVTTSSNTLPKCTKRLNPLPMSFNYRAFIIEGR
jgi:hypothetical protein